LPSRKQRETCSRPRTRQRRSFFSQPIQLHWLQTSVKQSRSPLLTMQTLETRPRRKLDLGPPCSPTRNGPLMPPEIAHTAARPPAPTSPHRGLPPIDSPTRPVDMIINVCLYPAESLLTITRSHS
jgi:hypothetical protein